MKILYHEIEIEFYDNIDDLKNAQEYDSDKNNIIILDDLNKDQLNDKRLQMLFKRGRHNNISVVVISHGFYELPKDTIRENSDIIHHFITNNFCNVESIHRQLSSTDMKIKEFKKFCHDVWLKDYNFITIDLTKNITNGKYRNRKIQILYFYLIQILLNKKSLLDFGNQLFDFLRINRKIERETLNKDLAQLYAPITKNQIEQTKIITEGQKNQLQAIQDQTNEIKALTSTSALPEERLTPAIESSQSEDEFIEPNIESLNDDISTAMDGLLNEINSLGNFKFTKITLNKYKINDQPFRIINK